jgi:hypothetical protein
MRNIGDAEFKAVKPSEIQELKKQVRKVSAGLKRIAQESSQNILDAPMSVVEKSQLRKNILKLPPDKISRIILLLKDTIDMSKCTDTVEFDLDKFSTRKNRELEQYVNKNMPKSRSSKPKKIEAKKTQYMPTPQAPPKATIPQEVIKYAKAILRSQHKYQSLH